MANDADILAALQSLSTGTRTRQLGQSQRRYVAPTARTNGPTLAERLQNSSGLRPQNSEVTRAQRGLNDYVQGKAGEYPTLAERLGRAQAGKTESSGMFGSIGSALLNNPITKVALNALSVVDTPRRAIISGARELVDVLDSDSETKGSFGDWFDQTKDTAYGFGTAFPIDGWAGRVLGFVGDVGLDPLTYATLGGAVPAKALLKGSTVPLRAALGTKNVAGRGGRAALAGLAEKMGASAELVADIAARGKSAFRVTAEGAEMADKMGLQRNGVYYLGSRVRVPLTGPIADFVESGLATARIGFLEHVPGMSKLQEAITPAGINKNLAKSRAAVARGAMPAERAAQFIKSETVEFTQRSRKKLAEGLFASKVVKLIEDPDVQAVAPDFYKFLDTPESYVDEAGKTVQLWKRPMTPVEQAAKAKYQQFWKELADEVDAAIRVTEPTFQMNRLEDFLPHVRTDEAAQMMESLRSARAEQIQQALKFNMANPEGSFMARTLGAGDSWFGHELTDGDIMQGVDRLNYLAMNPADNLEGMKGNFFETDMKKILAKYGDHYAHQIGMGGMLEEAFNQGLMKGVKTAPELNKDWVDAFAKTVKQTKAEVNRTMNIARNASRDVTIALQEELKRAKSPLQETLGELQGVVRTVGTVESRLENLAQKGAKLRVAQAEHRLAVQGLDNLFETKSVLVQDIADQLAHGDREMSRLIQMIDDVSDSIWTTASEPGNTLIKYEGRSMTVDEALLQLNMQAKTLSEAMNEAQKSSKFLDDLNEEVEHLMGSRLGNPDSTGDATLDRLVQLNNYPASRARGVPGSVRGEKGHGGLGEKFIKEATGPNSKYPELKAALEVINPSNSKSLTPRKLSQIFLHDYTDKDGNLVRGIVSRIANGVTTGTNHEEIRQAAAWLIVRDYKYASVTGTEFILDAPTQARHTQLVEMLKDADIANSIDTQRAINTRSGPRLGTPDRPVSGAQVTRAAEMENTKTHLAMKYQDQSRGLENARVELSAREDTLQALQTEFEAIPDPAPGDFNANRAIEQARERFVFAQQNVVRQRKIVDKWGALKDRAAVDVPKRYKKVVDQLEQVNGGVTRTVELATATAEYFLHREAVIQTERVAGLLHMVGYKPTPELYKHMLARVASDQLEKVEKFRANYGQAVDALTRLRDRVLTAEGGSSSLKVKFQEELRLLFTDRPQVFPAGQIDIGQGQQLLRDREMIREFFPELESVWRRGQSGRIEQLFARHPASQQLIDDLVAHAKHLGVKPEYTQGVNRGGGLIHFEEGGVAEATGNSVKRSRSQAAQQAMFESERINVRKLMDEVLRMEDERVTGKGATGANVVRERFAGKTSVQSAGKPLTTTLGDVLPDDLNVREMTPARIMERQRSEEVRHLHSRYDDIMLDIANDKAVAKEATKRTATNVGAETQGLVGSGEHYGFVAVIDQALRLGDRQVKDLFAEMLGGPRMVHNSEFSPTSIRRGKLVNIQRSQRQYKEIEEFESMTGRALYRAQSHANFYKTLSDDPLISTEALLAGTPGKRMSNGKWVPGSWAFNPDLHGSAGVADALDEYANRLNQLAATEERTSVAQGRLATERKAAREANKAPMSFSNQEIGLANYRDSQLALQLAKRKMEPAIERLERLKADPMYRRGTKHMAEQDFATELAKLSDEFVVKNGLFTPLEWQSLWNTGVVNISNDAPGMRGVQEMLANQLDVLGKQRRDLIRAKRSTRGIDMTIAKIRKAQAGEYDLGEFQQIAHAKFAQLYRDKGGDEKAIAWLKSTVKDSLDSETGMPLGVNTASPYGLNTAVEKRQALLRQRFEASPEAQHLSLVHQQQETISQGMIDHMLREPSHARRLQLGREYAKNPATKKQAPAAIQHVTRAPASEFPNSGPDVVGPVVGRRNFQSPAAANIYEKARSARKEANRIRRARIRELSEQLGRGDQRQVAHSKKVQDAVKEIESLLAKADIKLKPGDRPIDIAATAERTAKKLRTRVDDAGRPRAQRVFEVDEARRAELGAQRAAQSAPQRAELAQVTNDLMRFKLVKVMSGVHMDELQADLAQLTETQRVVLKQQFDLGEQLEKAMDNQVGVKGATKTVETRQARLLRADEALSRASVAYDVSRDFDTWGPAQIKQVELQIAEIDELVKTGGDVKRTVLGKHNTDWQVEAEDFIQESRAMLREVAGPNDNVTAATKKATALYSRAKAEYLKATHSASLAKQDAAIVKLVKGLDPADLHLASDIDLGFSRPGMQAGMTDAVRVFDEGFVQLSEYFPNIQVRKEVADIYQNIHRMSDPVFARELQKHLGKYTQFFKAYATLSPGFHLRNALSNTFMAIASGANVFRLKQGLKYSSSMLEHMRSGKSFESWVLTLPANEQVVMRGTLEAAAASGGGLIDDFLSELPPPGTKHAKQLGRWIEHHSRFMLAYDGVAGGFTPQQAAERVKRFLIDYQDISSLDATMRQIVPFWMWTSRNLPLQLQNMWLNPRAYQIYNSIKRNLQDDEEGDVVPQWMREMGAFKLPFGDNLYATPDLGFNRIQQQVNELGDPSKFIANVNPALRVPLEAIAGKQFFSGREFSPNPVEVSGGISPVLQPLLQALGYGTTGPDGTKFVDDRAYRSIQNLIPFLGASERLVPSAQTGKNQSLNALAGFLGIPMRENTADMQLGEIARRKRNASNISSRQKSLEEAMNG